MENNPIHELISGWLREDQIPIGEWNRETLLLILSNQVTLALKIQGQDLVLYNALTIPDPGSPQPSVCIIMIGAVVRFSLSNPNCEQQFRNWLRLVDSGEIVPSQHYQSTP